MDNTTLSVLSLALGLGLLIGLQRERAGSRLGGIRTFPLIALLGAVCGLLAGEWGALIVGAGFIGVIGIIVLANLEKLKDAADTGGQTTEAAALLTYALGAYLATENYAVAIVVGGVTAVLLQFKEPLHQFAGGMSESDIRAVMRFVIISLAPRCTRSLFSPAQRSRTISGTGRFTRSPLCPASSTLMRLRCRPPSSRRPSASILAPRGKSL